MPSCCRGFNARLLFLMGCAMVEYVSHTVVLVLSPMVAMHFYPTTSFPRLGFYTALLAGSGYLGHVISCRLWINVARSLKSSKGVILWGLAIIGAGFFSLLLCQSLLAMTLVRFTTGLFSGVVPVALIEIDTICGNRQTRLASSTKYLGTAIGAGATYLLIAIGNKLALADPASGDDAYLHFYPLCLVSVLAWIATVVTLIGLRVQSRSSYMQLAGDDDTNFFMHQGGSSALEADTPTHAKTMARSSPRPLELVKNAFEETFRINRKSAATTRNILATPRPHYRMIRSIIPHYYHGYTESGNVVVWDFVGQIKMDKLHSSGFTTVDIREHYRFFLSFGIEKLLKSSQKFVYVIDLEGLTLTDTDDRVVDMASTVITEMQKEFPDKLDSLAVINAPVWFSQVMSMIRPRISKRTAEKIAFFKQDTLHQDLLELIGVDSLPKAYGGRNGVEIGKASQERALDELLKQTTGSLEQTIEIIGKSNATTRRGRTGSVRAADDDGSDEEAFFDCSEYGLQDEFDDDDESEISLVVHSQASGNATEAVARTTVASSSPQRPKVFVPSTSVNGEKKVHNANQQQLKLEPVSSGSDQFADVAITREPHACLILLVLFFWLLVQLGFDELLPLWYFRQDGAPNGRVSSVPHPVRATVIVNTLSLAGTMATMAASVLFVQLCVSTSVSSNVMTPLATLRVGLLFQIPLIGCFPLLDLFEIEKKIPFAWAIVAVVLVGKHLMGGIAMHGILTLLDNSIAVDRRLAVHRAAQFVTYIAGFVASGMGPALFALLGYFAKSFPFNHSLLYFVQALGLVFLFLFSFAIPSRMNFPMLFAMGKR
uniref:CRAL-TRIO domain-containing protein n=1 Tax=Globisporangium ultimum (strain ATCC 200006 / CBS 805.95 / DAOM BR144) TaxID=431595 RepID=K3WKS4_GLOUD